MDGSGAYSSIEGLQVDATSASRVRQKRGGVSNQSVQRGWRRRTREEEEEAKAESGRAFHGSDNRLSRAKNIVGTIGIIRSGRLYYVGGYMRYSSLTSLGLTSGDNISLDRIIAPTRPPVIQVRVQTHWVHTGSHRCCFFIPSLCPRYHPTACHWNLRRAAAPHLTFSSSSFFPLLLSFSRPFFPPPPKLLPHPPS